jgi:branched-chain amino acid transport system ATP-binding protein
MRQPHRTPATRSAGPDDDPAGPAVELTGLRADVAGSHILHDVTLQVRAGGVTALLGRNGVGKTTTLRAMLGLQHATGTVRILGHDVTSWPTHKIVRLGVGYVPEDRDVFARLTVRENLRLAETGPQTRYELVYDLFPELKQRCRQLAGTLSGGQQQMLAIGRVLLHDRPLLLIDEPTEVTSVLQRIAEAATILMVEQNVHVVRELASDIIILDRGKVAHIGEVQDLSDESLVRRLLGVSAAT